MNQAVDDTHPIEQPSKATFYGGAVEQKPISKKKKGNKNVFLSVQHQNNITIAIYLRAKHRLRQKGRENCENVRRPKDLLVC